MADTQNQLYVVDFEKQIELEAQQAASFFRGKILEAPVKGKMFYHSNLGANEVSEVTSRFAPRQLTNPNHQRRGALIKSYEEVIPYTELDELRAMVDISSGYAKSLAQAMMRKVDQAVAEAALGSVLTGENCTVSVTAANDGVQSVTASSGLTYDIVRETIQKFYAKGVGLSGEQIYFAVTDLQWSTLMNEVEAISGDYNQAKAAETGVLPMILGAKFIVFPSGPATGNSIIAKPSTRSCFAFSTDGLKLGMLSDIKVITNERPDLQGNVKQVVVSASFGAIRTQGPKVIQINVTE